MTRTAGAVVG